MSCLLHSGKVRFFFLNIEKIMHSREITLFFYLKNKNKNLGNSIPIFKKELVSERWLFNANSAIFQLYHGENKLIFNEMMMRSALYLTNTLSWIVLAHWNNSPQIDVSPHLDTLSWFRFNPSLLFLCNAACLAEKQQIPILNSQLTLYFATFIQYEIWQFKFDICIQ